MKNIQQKNSLRLTPFAKTFKLLIKEQEPGFYKVSAISVDDGSPLPLEAWQDFFFYRYEANLFGLQAKGQNDELQLMASELLDVFSPAYQHPFVQFEGVNEETVSLLESVRALVPLWNDSALWNYAKTVEGDVEDFLAFELPERLTKEFPSNQSTEFLTLATYQKLISSGLNMTDIPSLVPFFQEGGWPIHSERTLNNLKVCLRLSEPEEGSEEWLLETVITTPTSTKHWTPAIRKRNWPIEKALPEKWVHLAEDIEKMQRQILSLLDLGADVDPSQNTFLYKPLEDAEVRNLLRDDFIKLAALGFEVILPSWLKELKQTKMRVRVSAQNSSQKSMAGLDDIVSFRWELSVGGEKISPEEFRKLVDEGREFVRVGNEWFRMDANWMEEIRELMEKAEKENWTVRELIFRELPEELSVPLEDEDDSEYDDPLFAFEMNKSLQDYVNQLQSKQGLPPVKVPDGLKAELRPYQQQGFEWLVFMRDQKFGAVLADDMGLGKTVQMISYLLHLYEALKETKPTLIICPTSVLGNW